jgi:glycosyltransferase involved in cell wall biosynthesis
MTPRFSVVVPAYNASATLPETLDAMLAQEYSDWECVIVDDGSTDATASIAQDYCERDGRFRLIRQENRGAAGAYRTGVATAAADLLIICAADDFLLPEHLRVMDDFIDRNSDYDIYSTNGEFLYEESGIRRRVYSGPEWQQESSLSFAQVISGCFYSVGVVFRRRVYESTGGHRLGVYVDDYDLWLRAMAQGARHRYTPRVLSVHRVSDFQQSADAVRVNESNIEVYENLLNEPSLQPSQRASIQESIARNRGMIADVLVDRVLEQQSRDLLLTVHRLVGEQNAEPAMRAIHRISWIARPVRLLIAKWRGRKD